MTTPTNFRGHPLKLATSSARRTSARSAVSQRSLTETTCRDHVPNQTLCARVNALNRR